jgi:DNA-binding protein H-NS
MEKLEKEAERVKASEIAGVVQRIKMAIDFYGLTKSDLFGTKPIGYAKDRTAGANRGKAKVNKTPTQPKYRDKKTGKTWTGHGKRPAWFVEAIDSGVKAEEMAT